jgi:hypothetical protein
MSKFYSVFTYFYKLILRFFFCFNFMGLNYSSLFASAQKKKKKNGGLKFLKQLETSKCFKVYQTSRV